MPIVMSDDDWDALNGGKSVHAKTTIKYELDGQEKEEHREFDVLMSKLESETHNQRDNFKRMNPFAVVRSVTTIIS